jgi:hypothetical protein
MWCFRSWEREPLGLYPLEMRALAPLSVCIADPRLTARSTEQDRAGRIPLLR